MKRASFSLACSFAVAVVATAWSGPVLAQEPAPLPPLDTTEQPPTGVERQTIIVTDSVAPPAPPSAPLQRDQPSPEGPPRYDLVRINGGLRTGYVPSRALDTFASNDVLAQLSLDATYPVFTSGRFVLGAGLGWDVGGRSAKLRNTEARLAVHRLYVPIEGRYHLLPNLAVFGKVAPGAIAALTSLRDASAPNELSSTGWAFSADASVGASILLGPTQNLTKRMARFWLTPEVGYALTTAASVRPSPGREEKDLLGSDEDTNIGTLALSGFFWRASLGVTF